MSILINLITASCIIFYLIAVLNLLVNLKENDSVIENRAPFWSLIGAIMHFIVISLDIASNQGVNNSLFGILSITAFFVVNICLVVQAKYPLRILLIPVLTISIICVGLANRINFYIPIGVTSSGSIIHILTSIIAYSLLCIVLLQAIAIQLIEYSLKYRNNTRWISQLPPLQTMETILFQFMTVGWIILTLSLLSGLLFIDNFFAINLLYKTILSILSWLTFGLLLFGHYIYGWRGNLAAILTLTAFITLAIGYFGSRFVIEIIL